MTVFIKKLVLTNIRGFKSLDLEFGGDEPRRLTCFIGRNGTNKTTLLRMIALGFCSTTGANILLRDSIQNLRRFGSTDCRIRIENTPGAGHVVYDYEVLKDRLEIDGKSSQSWGDKKFAVGYGIGRGEPSGVLRDRWESHHPLESLFRDHQPVLNPELFLRRFQDKYDGQRLEQLLEQIKGAVGLAAEDRISLEKGGGIVLNEAIPIDAWADGYRRTFFWIVDLFSWAMRANAIDGSNQIGGVLLIDEVEQHLHPSMQAGILNRLRQLFPRMQIIVTTHSPLVALGCHPGELIVLKQKDDHIIAKENLPNFQSFSIEDMLTDSDLFDTEPYSPEYSVKLREYHRLAEIPKENRTEQETIALIKHARFLRL